MAWLEPARAVPLTSAWTLQRLTRLCLAMVLVRDT
jgi:hypothetical protein